MKFTGWKRGARKIKFTMLLHEQGGLSLKDAKCIKDSVMGGGQTVEIDFKDHRTAQRICQEATLLGVACELVVETLKEHKL